MKGEFLGSMFISFFALGIGIMIGIMIGVRIQTSNSKTVRIEAVKLGFAKWVPDKKGETRFQWKEEPKP